MYEDKKINDFGNKMSRSESCSDLHGDSLYQMFL